MIPRPSARAVRGFLSLLGFLAGITPAPAQTGSQPAAEHYSFAWRGVLLEEALEQLITASRLDVGWDPALINGRRVHCVIHDAVIEDVLRCLLQGTGLDYYRLSTGTYVLTSITRTAPLYGNLSGRVTDAETGRPLSYANVVLADASGRATNEAGWFSFARLLPGTYRITASHLGYQSVTRTVVVPPGGLARIELPLQSRPILVNPIVVDGMAGQRHSRLLGTSELEHPDTPGLPAPGGSDVLGTLDALMGVRVSDVTADLHVQGGAAGEHQFRLDGAPVFIPLNVTSFTGPFSPFALEQITVHKAGFGASVGSQIAGVIEATHVLPATAPRRLDVQVDPLSINTRLGLHHTAPGGIEKTLMMAGRIGLWNLYAPTPLQTLLRDWNTIDTFILSAFSDQSIPFRAFESVGNPGLHFLDLHTAGRLRFGPLHLLSGSVYWGRTRLGNAFSGQPAGVVDPDPLELLATVPDTYRWDNGIAQARFESILGPRMLASVQARGSFYHLQHRFRVPDSLSLASPTGDANRVLELALSATLDYSLAEGHLLRGGTELTHTASHFTLAGTQIPLRHRFAGWRWSGFAEDRLSLGPHLTLETGSRFTYLASRRKLYVEPRLALRFDWEDTPAGALSLFLGTGIYQQYVNQFDVSSRSPRSFVSQTRFWMAVDSTISPPQALHYAAEVLYRPGKAWALRLEGYYKRQRHILAIDYAAETSLQDDNMPQRDFLKDSRGHTYGAAVQIERSLGPGRLLARYEYTDSRRSISDLFRNQVHRVPWIEPHNLEFRLDFQPLTDLTLLARWRGIWGRTWGFRKSYYDFVGAHLDDLSRILAELAETGVSNDARVRIANQVLGYQLDRPETHPLPPILQLDVSLAYTFRVGATTLQARADVLNLLDRENVADRRFFYNPDTYFAAGNDRAGLLEVENRPLLPRYASLAVRLSW
ncbi:MAG: TonB-dependent receptor [Rhodothermaceae bacterium]|nr:MAG: TonB-dependent receptor [Rhodothermaceae bacterium]